MNCCDAPGLLPLEQALETIFEAITPITATEKRSLDEAVDCILADTVTSPLNVPSYDNSAMDGYALIPNSAEPSDSYTVVGKSFAGNPYRGKVGPGECVRIMTGAPLPPECDRVIMQENCTTQDNRIEITTSVKLGENIRLTGNDIAKNQVVLEAGRRLSPTDIGLLASIGRSLVNVFRPLKIGLFSTGDELRLPQQTLDAACIYDSNRYVIAAALKRLNMDVLNLGIIPDDPDALRSAFERCQEECDAVISSGGVSVGEADYTKTLLDEIGDINFWKLAIKPGKPFAFGKLNNVPFFGLPGNPSSAAITFHQLAVPALLAMAGEKRAAPLTLTITANQDIRKRPGRTDFQRGVYKQDQSGNITLDSSLDQSSGMLSSMSKGNCYIKLEQQRGDIKAGEKIEIVPFDRWLE